MPRRRAVIDSDEDDDDDGGDDVVAVVKARPAAPHGRSKAAGARAPHGASAGAARKDTIEQRVGTRDPKAGLVGTAAAEAMRKRKAMLKLVSAKHRGGQDSGDDAGSSRRRLKRVTEADDYDADVAAVQDYVKYGKLPGLRTNRDKSTLEIMVSDEDEDDVDDADDSSDFIVDDPDDHGDDNDDDDDDDGFIDNGPVVPAPAPKRQRKQRKPVEPAVVSELLVPDSEDEDDSAGDAGADDDDAKFVVDDDAPLKVRHKNQLARNPAYKKPVREEVIYSESSTEDSDAQDDEDDDENVGDDSVMQHAALLFAQSQQDDPLPPQPAPSHRRAVLDDSEESEEAEDERVGQHAPLAGMSVGLALGARDISESFQVYCQYLALGLADPSFLVEVRRSRESIDSYYRNCANQVEERVSSRQHSLVSSSAWNTEILRHMSTLPGVRFGHNRNTSASECQACNRRGHTASCELFMWGQAYDAEGVFCGRKVRWEDHLPQANRVIVRRYFVGPVCANRVTAYMSLMHWKLFMLLAISKRLRLALRAVQPSAAPANRVEQDFGKDDEAGNSDVEEAPGDAPMREANVSVDTALKAVSRMLDQEETPDYRQWRDFVSMAFRQYNKLLDSVEREYSIKHDSRFAQLVQFELPGYPMDDLIAAGLFKGYTPIFARGTQMA